MAEAPTRLQLIRMARGLTQAQAAELAGISQVTCFHAERGRASATTLAKLAAAFEEAQPDRLLERTWDLAEVRATALRNATSPVPPAAPSAAPDDQRILSLIRTAPAQ